MIDFTIETDIERPVSEVFAYVTDPAKLPTWQTNTIEAAQEGDGPLGLGTQIHETHRGPGGRPLESVVEVSEFEPDRVFALTMVEGSVPIHARITFEPSEAGTKMAFNAFGQMHGLMRVAQPLVRVGLKRQFKEHCANLKRVLEAQPSAP